jgi:hypothetical protein
MGRRRGWWCGPASPRRRDGSPIFCSGACADKAKAGPPDLEDLIYRCGSYAAIDWAARRAAMLEFDAREKAKPVGTSTQPLKPGLRWPPYHGPPGAMSRGA